MASCGEEWWWIFSSTSLTLKSASKQLLILGEIIVPSFKLLLSLFMLLISKIFTLVISSGPSNIPPLFSILKWEIHFYFEKLSSPFNLTIV